MVTYETHLVVGGDVLDGIWIVVVAIGFGIGVHILWKASMAKPIKASVKPKATMKPQAPTETPVKPSALRWLPSAFYVIAILGFAGFVILAIQSENSFLFGYGVGATIACFGSGRLIELVQDINDELYRKRMSE